MLGHMSVARKMYGSFTAVVALGVAGGWVGYQALDQVSEESELALAALELEVGAGEMNVLQNGFILFGIEDKEHGEELLKEHKAVMDEYHTYLTAIRSSFDLDDAEREALASIEEANKEYDQVFAEVADKFHEIEEYKEELDELGEQVDEQLAHVLHEHEADLAEMQSAGASMAQITLQVELIERLAECELLALRVSHNEVGFLLDKKIERVKAMEQQLGSLRGELTTVEAMIPQCAKDKAEETSDLATLAKVEHELDKYQGLLGKIIEDELIVAADLIDCTDDLKLIEHTAVAFAERAEHLAVAEKNESHRAAIALMVIVAVVGLLFAFFITRGITKPLSRVIAGLNDGAEQVTDASAQVSGASQQLAGGASEQASSLEETSSALEEMSAMTRTNAENAKQADVLTDQVTLAAQGADRTMEQLNSAMGAINDSSGQISKIIKVIEEIAFQTNLLALNAAVEAARAGEHGKGFAVVADEVRNLAQRAAQAARETTGLIEDSVNKAKEGTDVAGEVGKALGAIVGDITKVSDLVSGIAKASEEQAQGVDQVNTAVSQMDKVTQQNAAGAEESASAAEELSAQAVQVKGNVNELMALANGGDAQAVTAVAPE
ncbi:MAG: hypothetical protein GY842_12535 [bacterium]|nr:hypothetical protein [bacterium]